MVGLIGDVGKISQISPVNMRALGTNMASQSIICTSHSPRCGNSGETICRDGSSGPPWVSPHSVSKNGACTLVHPENQAQPYHGRPYHGGTPGTCTEHHHCPSSQATSFAGHQLADRQATLPSAVLLAGSVCVCPNVTLTEGHSLCLFY